MTEELRKLLQHLQPRMNEGVYAFVMLGQDDVIPEGTISWIHESEGISVIVPFKVAERLKLPISFKADWITLDVHSDLPSVGLTAAVSTALASVGISCNIVAGYHHDHLFVPTGKGQEALQVLLDLQAIV